MFGAYRKALVLAVWVEVIRCQDLSWTWKSGSKGSNTLQSLTNPGGRSGMAYWSFADTSHYPDRCSHFDYLAQDLQDECAKLAQLSVWAFGGEYHVENSKNLVKNDLWKFSTDDNSWILLHNGTADNRSSVPAARQLAAACGLRYSYFVIYGGLDADENVLGDTWIHYKANNQWYTLEAFRKKMRASEEIEHVEPAPRGDMVVWCTSEEMIIYGGFDEKNGLRHDMWIFDLAKLSWRQSKSSSELPSDPYFVKNLNYPAGRSGSVSWVSGEKLFMFGGNIGTNNPRSKHRMTGYSNDLWEFNMKNQSWTHRKGSRKVCSSPGVYGKLGTASENNQPGCRRRAAAWVDYRGNLWMFGGDGVDDSQQSVSSFKPVPLLADLWFYDLDTDMWTWKGGQHSGEQKGKYGELTVADKDNLPGPRCEMVVWNNWNYFYLFGGVGHDAKGHDGYLNDVWQLDVHLDPAVFKNAPYAGVVFGIIILACTLVVIMICLYMFGKKHFQEKDEETKGKYQQIPLEADADV